MDIILNQRDLTNGLYVDKRSVGWSIGETAQKAVNWTAMAWGVWYIHHKSFMNLGF